MKKFTFTVEEREVVVPIRHDLAVMRTEEYPTLINVQTEEWFAKDIKREAKTTGRSEDELRAENTILVQSIGVGSCWIGGAQRSLTDEKLLKELGAPEGYIAIVPLIFGYPKGKTKAPDRIEPKVVWVK